MRDIVFFLPPSFETAGGGSAYARHLMAALRKLGCRVAAVAIEDRDGARRAWDALAEPAFGVIDGMVLPLFDAGADRPAWLDGRAAALVHHPTALAGPARRDLVRAAERRLLPQLRCVVATSEGVGARLVAEFGVSAERLRIVAPGMADLPRSAGAGGTCRILSVGRMAPRKGHDVLLRALARLPDLDWHLAVAGDSHGERTWAEALGTLAAGLGIAGRVELLEHPCGAALEQLWRSADLFALASRRETTAAAIAEALKRGLPVAVTGWEDVPHGAGTMSPVEDDVALSHCLRRMIFDGALRGRMAQAAWSAGRALPGWPVRARCFLDALQAGQDTKQG